MTTNQTPKILGHAMHSNGFIRAYRHNYDEKGNCRSEQIGSIAAGVTDAERKEFHAQMCTELGASEFFMGQYRA